MGLKCKFPPKSRLAPDKDFESIARNVQKIKPPRPKLTVRLKLHTINR